MVYICNMVKFTSPKYHGTFYYGNTMVFFQQGIEAQRAEGWDSWGAQLVRDPQRGLGGAESPPKLNLVHFSRKIWHLVTAND